MKKCDICGRETNKIVRMKGYSLCSKHMHQLLKYGKFLDNIPRTNNDLNDYRIEGNEVIFNLYGQNNVKNGEFIIDLTDIELVKYHKWRLSHQHVVTGLPSNGTQRDLAHVILKIKPSGVSEYVVDHINGNPMDNRRRNLRICKQSDNTLNKKEMSTNTSGFIGVSYDKERGMWASEIRYGYKRCHFPRALSIKVAVYQRYIAEQILFKEFANETEQKKKYEYTKDLPQDLKAQIEKVVTDKINDKFSGD